MYRVVAYHYHKIERESINICRDMDEAIDVKIETMLNDKYSSYNIVVEDNEGNKIKTILSPKHIKIGAIFEREYNAEAIREKLIIIDNENNNLLVLYNLNTFEYYSHWTFYGIENRLIEEMWKYIGQHDNIDTLKLLYGQ